MLIYTVRVFQREVVNTSNQLSANLQHFWDKQVTSTHEHEVMTKKKDLIHYAEGKFSVDIPWSDSRRDLPNNYTVQTGHEAICKYRKEKRNYQVLAEWSEALRSNPSCMGSSRADSNLLVRNSLRQAAYLSLSLFAHQ